MGVVPNEELNTRLLGDDMTDRNEMRVGSFECVEPEIGARIWQLTSADSSEALKEELAEHLLVCSSCRLDALVADRVAEGLRAGELHLGESGAAATRRGGEANGRRTNAMIAAASSLALAASLVLMFGLPPASRMSPELLRGQGGRGAFLRPVEGEVVTVARPGLRWTPIAGATAYQVEISQVDGPWSWSGRADEASLVLPPVAALPADGEFRALVEPIPADLAGLVDTSVYFKRSGLLDFLGYRAGAAPRWVLGLGWLGLLGLGWAVVARIRLR